jgi:hypothetical protein
MFAYLVSEDIPEVGYTLRTASLMSQPEYEFDPANVGDYALLGIRYVILPAQQPSPAPPPGAPPGAILVLRNSLYRVFELPGNSYFRVVDTVGTITSDRSDVGSQSLSYLRSPLPGEGRYLTVGYAGARAARPTLPLPAVARGPAGTVLAEHTNLADGTASAAVRLRRRAVVVLSESFDPGWNVTVDGRRATTQMVAPALVAVQVPPGTHRVVFRYAGFGYYPELLALALLTIATLAIFTRREFPHSMNRPEQPGRRPLPNPR